MGVDVVFKARTHPRLDEEAFEDLRYRFHEHFPDPYEEPGRPYRFPDLRWDVGNGCQRAIPCLLP